MRLHRLRIRRAVDGAFLLLLLFFAVLLLLLLLRHLASLFSSDPTRPLFLMSTEKLLDNAHAFNSSLRPLGRDGRPRIALVSVLDGPRLAHEFQFALSTVRCYTLRHSPRYSHFVLISPGAKSVAKLQSANYGCAQQDFMFRRHCFVANWMRDHPSFDWVLFLDADMAVVNPNRTVEEYMRPAGVQIVFIDRLFNKEIMAGSYLAKNTAFSRAFLHSWADFFFKLPDSFHGTDNGAIQALFMEKFIRPSMRNACQPLWEKSKNFDDLFLYEACVRFYIDQQMDQERTFREKKVAILAKAKGWVRDGGHTDSLISPRDFMFHGWKNSTYHNTKFNPWLNPFQPDQHFDNEQICANGSSWAYGEHFLAEERTVERMLEEVIGKTEKEYGNQLEQLGLGAGLR